MKRLVLFAVLATLSLAPPAKAQFGSGIVFDPTQSFHAFQQIVQGTQIYETTVQSMENAIQMYT